MTSFIDDVDEDTLATYAKEPDEAGIDGQWLTYDDNCVRLFVQFGYLKIPLKMVCGHVFCAECIATHVNNPLRVQCPYRDYDYGIVTKPTVYEIACAMRAYRLERSEFRREPPAR